MIYDNTPGIFFTSFFQITLIPIYSFSNVGLNHLQRISAWRYQRDF